MSSTDKERDVLERRVQELEDRLELAEAKPMSEVLAEMRSNWYEEQDRYLRLLKKNAEAPTDEEVERAVAAFERVKDEHGGMLVQRGYWSLMARAALEAARER
jgi:hypothetical protein